MNKSSNTQYIQCPQCKKKYGVNDKVRAAAGKKISCKACGERFEIVLLEKTNHSQQNKVPDSNSQEKTSAKAPEKIKSPATSDSDSHIQAIAPQATKGSKTDSTDKPATPLTVSTAKRKRRNAADSDEHLHTKAPKKISPSSILGVLILAISVYVFYLDRGGDLGQPFVNAKPPQPAAKSEPAKPIEIAKKTPANSSSNSAENEYSTNKIPSHKNLSKSCKEVAAKQWMLDYTMTHGKPKSNEYARLLDQAVNNSAQIRKECGHNYFVNEVLHTAQTGSPPEWLVDTLSELSGWDKSAPRF